MVIALRRKDRAIKIDAENIFAKNHEEEMTVEGILEGYERIMKHQAVQDLHDLLLEPDSNNGPLES